MPKKRNNQEQNHTAPHYAIVCARGLGDALISMVLAHNLARHHISVTLYSSVLCQLSEWFPQCQIAPFPNEQDFFSTFSSYSHLVVADHALLNEAHDFGNQLMILKESRFNKHETMVTNLQQMCKEILVLPNAGKEIGIQPRKHLKFKANPKRVLLHPTSTCEKKNWPATKFIALASKLRDKGFTPVFCVSPSEREEWKMHVSEEQLPLFPTVSDLASFVYESGYLIGNDSGIGHLASALNIPTLSIFARKSYANLWRPGWGYGHIITPPPLLLGSRLKQRYWKQMLSVDRVLKAFCSHFDQPARKP